MICVDLIYFIVDKMSNIGTYSLLFAIYIYLYVIIFSLFHKIVFLNVHFRKYITYESNPAGGVTKTTNIVIAIHSGIGKMVLTTPHAIPTPKDS